MSHAVVFHRGAYPSSAIPARSLRSRRSGEARPSPSSRNRRSSRRSTARARVSRTRTAASLTPSCRAISGTPSPLTMPRITTRSEAVHAAYAAPMTAHVPVRHTRCLRPRSPLTPRPGPRARARAAPPRGPTADARRARRCERSRDDPPPGTISGTIRRNTRARISRACCARSSAAAASTWRQK